MGNYSAGRFNLIISLRYNADAAELDLWQQSFQKGSELLFAATDGQQELGNIYVCNNSTGGRNADAWLDEDPGSSSSNARIWEEFMHVFWKNDEKYKPFIIVHELGHYLYALGDEYKSSGGGSANCIGDPADTPNACIMERGWGDGDRFGDTATGGAFIEGTSTDFCVVANHDLGTGADDTADDTVQSSRHGEACWQTMVDTYPDLTLPGTLPDDARPAGAGTINWVELTQDLRFVLALDRSYSMNTDGGKPMEEAIYGASFWADSSLSGDFLGVVGFDNLIETHPMGEIVDDGDRDAAANFISALTPRGNTAIGDALRQGMNLITGAGDQSCTQVIVLFSDGMHNTGEDPLDVLPDLIDNGIRVYTVGFGPYADVDRLTAIAEGTGGTFYQIDSASDLAAAEIAIRDTLITLSSEVRDDGGTVTADAAIMDSEEDDYEAFIDDECSVATFAVSWQGSSSLTMVLRSPDGRVIHERSAEPDVRHAYRGMPFCLFQVRKPAPGLWRYTVTRRLGKERLSYGDWESTGYRGSIPYHHYVFTESAAVQFNLSSPRRRYELREPIQILGQVSAKQLVTGLPVRGHVTHPNGEQEEIVLVDNGNIKAGSETEGSGRFSTIFHPVTAGHYTFTFEADNRAGTAHPAFSGDIERTRKRGSNYQPPRFIRKSSLTVLVGKPQTCSGTADPKVFKQDSKGKLRLTLKNIPWVPGVSKLTVGRDVLVSEIPSESCRNEMPTFFVTISDKAKPGFRDMIVEVGRQHYRLEGALEILGKEPPQSKPSKDRLYRPGFVIRKGGVLKGK
ncbi:MAG: VWA domain-containing protein [Thermodesulfobacteriota bacterium]